MNLRNPKIALALRGAALCAMLASVAVLLSLSPPGSQLRSASDATAGADTEAAKVGENAGVSKPAAPPRNIRRRLVAESGDTFMQLFINASIPRAEAHEAIAAMRKVFNPRDLRPGHTITATFRPSGKDGDGRQFLGFVFEPAIDRKITVRRNEEGGFSAKRIDRKVEQRVTHIGGVIHSNLFEDGVNAGLPAGVLIDMIKLFSWDIDFQRDVRPGDSFNVMVQRSLLKDGRVADWGNLIYAELTLSGTTKRFYRFEYKDKHGHTNVGYYDDKGRSARKALLKTPIDGARLSSRFGRRRHPILGYTRMHRGVDFAAPSGTPIYAAGNGTIAAAGRNGGYGRYIRIRHTRKYSTAYAHMRRFARGIRRGKHVKQGDIIGYVGSTGLATGPHLHYEVLISGHQVNPLHLRLPSGHNLAGRELKTFQSVRIFLDRRLAKLSGDTRLTSR